MDQHYNIVVPKPSITMEKKRRYGVAKADLIQQVQAFKTHYDPFDRLPAEDLVRQALKLMTNEDPQGYRTTGDVSIEQILTALINNATDRAGLLLARIVREHKKGLTAVAQVQKYQKQNAAKLDDIKENDDYDDGYNADDIENPIFDDSDDSEVEALAMLKDCGEESNPPPDQSSGSFGRQLLMAPGGIETVANARGSVQGQRSRVPTDHYRPESTKTKRTKRSVSASVAATASSAVSGDSVAPLLPPVLPAVLPAATDPALLHNVSNPQVSNGVLPASVNGMAVDTTGAADVNLTAGTHGNGADAALMSDEATAQGFSTQDIEDLQHSSGDDDSVHVPSQCDHEENSSSEDSDDDASIQSQQSHPAVRQRESFDGYASDKFLECFNTIPTANVMHYRAPGSFEQGQHGPVALQEVHLPPAGQVLAVGVNDSTKLSIDLRDLSFERRTKLLHRNWRMLHNFQSLEQIRHWLENMDELGHIYLVHAHAAFLNSQPDMDRTFGETTRLFWNLVNSHGIFQNDRLIIEQPVALAEVTVEYLIVRSASE